MERGERKKIGQVSIIQRVRLISIGRKMQRNWALINRRRRRDVTEGYVDRVRIMGG